MPKIVIQEDDLTQATGTVPSDVVFIPGINFPAYREALEGERATHVYDPNASYEEAKSTEGATFIADATLQYREANSIERKDTSITKYYYDKTNNSYKEADDKNPGTHVNDIYISKYRTAKTGETPTHRFSGKAPYRSATDTEKAKYIKIDKPTLYTSYNDFKKNYPEPYIFESDSELVATDETNKTNKTPLVKKDSLDLSYIMAVELLKAGMPVVYWAFDPTVTEDMKNAQIVSGFYKALTFSDPASDITSVLEEIEDKNEYTIKYITTGGYPNFGSNNTSVDIASNLIKCAENRGDAVALVEATNNPARKHSELHGAVESDNTFNDNGTFGAMFSTWGIYRLNRSYKVGDTSIDQISLPACFGYLATLASNIKTSPNYLAFAGINRGIIPGLKMLDTDNRLSNKIADSFQPTLAMEGIRAINAITDIKPYGLTIWGNRTLATVGENGLKASNFLNVRNMVSDIKKVAYRAAKSLMFEQNNETLWLNFKGMVTPLLEQLKSGGGISNYKLIKLPTKYTGGTLGKEEFACAIMIIPIYPVESFEITVVMTDSDIAIGE